MAEQANVYFFSIRKSFRKHIKMIKYQDEKQAKAIGKHGKQLTKATNEFIEKESLPPTKEKKKHSKILLMKECTKWKNSHRIKLNDAEKNQVVKSKVKSIWVIWK